MHKRKSSNVLQDFFSFWDTTQKWEKGKVKREKEMNKKKEKKERKERKKEKRN